jgi:hypothetical protein
MQSLWQDIDRARADLGMGGTNGANGSSMWGLEAWLAWIPGGSTCVALTTGALTLARKLPIVGSLVDLLPLPRSDGGTGDG